MHSWLKNVPKKARFLVEASFFYILTLTMMSKIWMSYARIFSIFDTNLPKMNKTRPSYVYKRLVINILALLARDWRIILQMRLRLNA